MESTFGLKEFMILIKGEMTALNGLFFIYLTSKEK